MKIAHFYNMEIIWQAKIVVKKNTHNKRYNKRISRLNMTDFLCYFYIICYTDCIIKKVKKHVGRCLCFRNMKHIINKKFVNYLTMLL